MRPQVAKIPTDELWEINLASKMTSKMGPRMTQNSISSKRDFCNPSNTKSMFLMSKATQNIYKKCSKKAISKQKPKKRPFGGPGRPEIEISIEKGPEGSPLKTTYSDTWASKINPRKHMVHIRAPGITILTWLGPQQPI